MNGIDLNSDMGESFGRWRLGDDESLLSVVSSANVACGFHAGDPSVMLRTLETAAVRGVTVGAHVAYRDLAGFGRRYVDATPAELKADVMYQIAALEGLAHAAGTADRAYNPDGTLVSRRLPGAVIADPAVVAARVLRMATRHEVEAVDGSVVTLNADSVCVHGDSPSAVAMARAVRANLEAEGIEVLAFAADREETRRDFDGVSGHGVSTPEASGAARGGISSSIGRQS